MRLNDFLYVITLVEEKSFSKAAAKLYISQSALSQAIKRIESEIGSTLFTRTLGNFDLTPAGKLVVEYGTEMLRYEQELMKKLTQLPETSTLYIGTGSFGAKNYLPTIVHDFSAKFPNINIQVSEGHSTDMQKSIINGDIDICMLHTPILCQDELEFIPLFDERVLLAVPHDHRLSVKYGISTKGNPVVINLKDAANEPFVFWKRDERFGKRAMNFCTEYGFTPNIVVEIMDFEAINALIACGMGVGFVTNKIPDVQSGEQPNYYSFRADNSIRTYGLVYCKKSVKRNIIDIYVKVARKAYKNS